MAENDSPNREEPVCNLWQRMLEGVLGVCLLVGVSAMVRYYPATQPQDLQRSEAQKNDLQRQVQQLGHEVQQLQQEQAMPALVLHRYRNSICYIFGIYHVGFPGHQPEFRARISGTGFVVSDGLLATNRHVAEPWYEDQESAILIRNAAMTCVSFLPKERLVQRFTIPSPYICNLVLHIWVTAKGICRNPSEPPAKCLRSLCSRN